MFDPDGQDSWEYMDSDVQRCPHCQSPHLTDLSVICDDESWAMSACNEGYTHHCQNCRKIFKVDPTER